VQQGAAGYANDIDPASNRLQRAAGPGGTRIFTYDAEGNIKTDGTLSFEFALHGRMRSVSGTAGKTTYWYNALGQRVRKTGQDTTYYFYDGEGRVLGEYDRNGSAIQETVYLDSIPVVVLKQEKSNTVPYYIYADHINTPRVITRASDNGMVWRWDRADPFGAAAPDAILTGTGTFAYNPRFPGQLFDAESGLHQNYFRDYDPRTGRYLQSDPIGLKGGINTYTYTEGNPLSYSDPLGLKKFGKNHPHCIAIRNKKIGLQNELDMRWSKLTGGIPERIGPGEALKETMRGHRKLINKADSRLRKWEKQYDNDCDDNDPDNDGDGAKACDACPSGTTVVKTAAGLGAAYVMYRCVRMLPSLLPPLWWSIPANAAIP
jgi:RHS repeat-associated protein